MGSLQSPVEKEQMCIPKGLCFGIADMDHHHMRRMVLVHPSEEQMQMLLDSLPCLGSWDIPVMLWVWWVSVATSGWMPFPAVLSSLPGPVWYSDYQHWCADHATDKFYYKLIPHLFLFSCLATGDLRFPCWCVNSRHNRVDHHLGQAGEGVCVCSLCRWLVHCHRWTSRTAVEGKHVVLKAPSLDHDV